MGDFEISLFLWGLRHDCLNRETIFRFADLVLRMRSYHGACLHAMIEMCSIYETKNILSAVLHLLILGEKKEKVYHQWYELDVYKRQVWRHSLQNVKRKTSSTLNLLST